MNKIDLVVAGYVFNEDKVLLIHHAKSGLWLPLGGHIDPNETPDSALIREIKEEIGLEVELLNQNPIPLKGNIEKNLAVPFYCNVHPVGDHHHSCFFYICKALNPEDLKLEEGKILDYKWLTKEELKQDFVPEDVRNIAYKAFEAKEKLNK
jgi:8-oxo-dGTP diphosphatase